MRPKRFLLAFPCRGAKFCIAVRWAWEVYNGQDKLVAVESQCCENYFYSKDQAAAAEKAFQAGEGFYSECVRSIRFELPLRNAANENQTGKNNIHAFGLRLDAFKQLLIGQKKGDATDNEVLEPLECRWRSACFDSWRDVTRNCPRCRLL